MLKYFKSTEHFLRFCIWASLVLVVVTDFLFINILGIKLVFGDEQVKLIIAVLVCLLLSAFIMPKLVRKSAADGFHKFSFGVAVSAHFIELMAWFALFVSSFVILSYIAASSNRPLYDAEIYAIDKYLGFDWLAYIAWINKHPQVNEVFKFAYHSAFQIPILFLALTVSEKYARLYSVMLCLILSVVMVIFISYFYPTIQPFTYLNIRQEDFPNVYVMPGYWHIQDLYMMRNNTGKAVIDLSNLKGIIGFPSFHTCISLILAWGFWSIAFLRIPCLLLNMVMLAAIPVSGGHYLTDMIVGGIISISVILLVSRTVIVFNKNTGL